jgi:hypothetical protein
MLGRNCAESEQEGNCEAGLCSFLCSVQFLGVAIALGTPNSHILSAIIIQTQNPKKKPTTNSTAHFLLKP